ncbi:MAG: hypothetical protein K1X74_02145 [Pirellulales bacterium]|nr:hypothetical protein [Pirellulales bacterium]
MKAHEFLVEHYKLSLGYLEGQFNRLWQRFQFFLTVQLALFAGFGWCLLEQHNVSCAVAVCGLGVLVSLVWYLFAAQDRYLAESYRARVKAAARRIATRGTRKFAFMKTAYVGKKVVSCVRPLQLTQNSQPAIDSPAKWITSWYCDCISITRLPVWIALVMFVVWIVAAGVAVQVGGDHPVFRLI